MSNLKPDSFPSQSQKSQPGKEWKMKPQPDAVDNCTNYSQLMKDKVVLITGGDSGIGRAVAALMAQHGADVSITYYNEDTDAKETKKLIEDTGKSCLLLQADIKDSDQCKNVVQNTVNEFGSINCLINNAAVQFPAETIHEIDFHNVRETVDTNIMALFYFVKHTYPHLKEHDTIINTTSVTAYRGSKHLVDYSATKGAIVSATRSLAELLAPEGIRVNGVAPGPVWTPLIPATFPPDQVKSFGQDVPLERAGQPFEIAPCFLFLASSLSSYMTGQVLHPNGGEIINT